MCNSNEQDRIIQRTASLKLMKNQGNSLEPWSFSMLYLIIFRAAVHES
jgi:hypothetical protein